MIIIRSKRPTLMAKFMVLLMFITLFMPFVTFQSEYGKVYASSDLPPTWTVSNVTYYTHSATTVELHWPPANDDQGILYYRISGLDQVHTVQGSVYSYEAADLIPGNTYTVKVEAIDTAGQASDNSPTTTFVMPDITPLSSEPPDNSRNILDFKYIDTNGQRGYFSGAITWTGARDESNYDGYKLFYLDAERGRIEGGEIASFTKKPDKQFTYSLQNVTPPADARYILVTPYYSANGTDVYNDYYGMTLMLADNISGEPNGDSSDPSVPAQPAMYMEFYDEDLSPVLIGGLLYWQDPYEAAFDGYRLYYLDENQERIKPIVEIKDSYDEFYDFELPKGTQPPLNAEFVGLYSYNAYGESAYANIRSLDSAATNINQFQFIDEDPSRAVVKGTLSWKNEPSHPMIKGFHIYFMDPYYETLGDPIEVTKEINSLRLTSETPGANEVQIPAGTTTIEILTVLADGREAMPYMLNYQSIRLANNTSAETPTSGDYEDIDDVVHGIVFEDHDSTVGTIGGTLKFNPASSGNVDRYSIYFLDGNKLKIQAVADVRQDNFNNEFPEFPMYYGIQIPIAAVIPPGAEYIGVFARGGGGENSVGREVHLEDDVVHHIHHERFVDVDPSREGIRGEIVWDAPQDQSGITSYAVQVMYRYSEWPAPQIVEANQTRYIIPVESVEPDQFGWGITPINDGGEPVYDKERFIPIVNNIAATTVLSGDTELFMPQAHHVTFRDINRAAGQISGFLEWDREFGPEGVREGEGEGEESYHPGDVYEIALFDEQANKLTAVAEISEIAEFLHHQIFIPDMSTLIGANNQQAAYIGVMYREYYSYSDTYTYSVASFVRIDDLADEPSDAFFLDTDWEANKIGGTVRWTPDGSHTGYAVYFADESFNRDAAPIGTVAQPNAIDQLHIQQGTLLPPHARSIAVYPVINGVESEQAYAFISLNDIQDETSFIQELKGTIDPEQTGIEVDNVINFLQHRISVTGSEAFDADDIKYLLQLIEPLYVQHAD